MAKHRQVDDIFSFFSAQGAFLATASHPLEIVATTQFPRWVNAETREGLDTVPQAGKAVLFYSQLPDGNMDDWSQHAALPVRKGEKWLMNLW